MKKETLLEIILGTIGSLFFAIGMCMCLIPEWNLFKAGCIVTIVGFIILLCIIPIYRSSHPKKQHGPMNWRIVFTWGIGVIGAFLLGFGMSQIMVGNPSQTDLLIGMAAGIVGLIIIILNYPIYAYLKKE